MNPIYLDQASTTVVDPQVLKAMLPYFSQLYANPSSLHEEGRKVKGIVAECRRKIAGILNAQAEEIIFTSGGTESNNLAIKGIALARGKGHIITSRIEHPSVLEVCKHLETKGFSVTYLPVDKCGLIILAELEKAIRKDTILITIMYANNEIGTVQPIREIGKIAQSIAQKQKISFHTDACQAGWLDLNVQKLNVDLLTLNSSKIYGPKGVGILYRRKGLTIEPLLHGGGQEFGLRSGTENVPGIVGLGKALELRQQGKEGELKRLMELRHYFIRQVLKEIPVVVLNGHPRQSLPGIINLSFAGVEAESLVHYLSQQQIYVSSGSACASNQVKVSHVLKAIKAKYPRGSIRFSLGKETSKKELQEVVKALREIVPVLRKV
ncbi:MAG: cysteine desulfurase family protein [Nanoarchaeota archaeon]